MNTIWRIFIIFFVLCVSHCRDYYIGMFKRNDFLVAQDRLYKEKIPYQRVIAKYGRVLKCPVTYFRVVDRLGYGGGPRVEIIRGGLLRKYIVARMTSPYNLPISVNIYIGCENKMTTTTIASTDNDKNTESTDNGTVTGAGENELDTKSDSNSTDGNDGPTADVTTGEVVEEILGTEEPKGY